MTLTIKVNYNHQPAPADERTVEMMIHYTDMVTTFTDSASPDRHLRYFGSWNIERELPRGDC